MSPWHQFLSDHTGIGPDETWHPLPDLCFATPSELAVHWADHPPTCSVLSAYHALLVWCHLQPQTPERN